MARAAVAAWSDDYAPSMGAALAYYALFSIAPLMLIAVAIAGFVFGEAAARGQIVAQLRDLIGDAGALTLQTLLEDARRPARGTLAAVIGVVTLLVGATSVFGELQDALDRIWRVPRRPGGTPWLELLRTRLLSFGIVLAIGFLLLVSLLVGAAIAAIGHWWSAWFGHWQVLAHALDVGLGWLIATLAFALLYKLVPRARVAWRDVWIGATATAVLFVVGKFAIGLYLGRASFASAFGAAGSVVVLLAWTYYAAQVFLLGAEFTWVYAHTCGSLAGHKAPAPADDRQREAAAVLAASRERLADALHDAAGRRR
jgi:membrane protein